MTQDSPKVNIDLLILKDNKVLLGLLAEKWSKGEKLYGVPGQDLKFRETIADAVARNVKEELGCELISYKIICVNESFALGNHYIGIGVQAEIEGEPVVMRKEDWVQWEWRGLDDLPPLFEPAGKLIKYVKNLQ